MRERPGRCRRDDRRDGRAGAGPPGRTSVRAAALERRERLVGPARRGRRPRPSPVSRAGVVRGLGAAPGGRGASASSGRPSRSALPAPALEAPGDVLAPRRCWRARRPRRGSKRLAGARELAGGVQADRLLGERAAASPRGVTRTRRGASPPTPARRALTASRAASAATTEQARRRRAGGQLTDGRSRACSAVRVDRGTGAGRTRRAARSRRGSWRRGPPTLASISFMSFIASMMQRIWPSFTTSPSLHVRDRRSGDEAR